MGAEETVSAFETLHESVHETEHETGEHIGEEHHGAHVSTAQFPLLFLFVSLVIGVLCRQLLERSNNILPYTVVLLGCGIILSTINHYEHVGELGDSLDQWTHIDPHLILYAFLPPLVFESAFSMDYHVFRRSLAQILMLAFPGVIISLFLGGLFMKGIYDDWTWTECFTIGSILAATDPVAVVALLKDLGASKELGTLIEGESLMNDGSAMVVFILFRDLAVGEDYSAGDVVEFGCQLAIGGWAWGWAFGMVSVFLVGIIYNDPLSEITLTVFTCFLCFYVAESQLEVSSVLATVACGLYFANVGKLRITPTVETSMHHFWELLSFFANTIIFVLAGAIIAERALLNGIIDGYDWGMLFVLYIVLHAVRGIVVLLLRPIMVKFGYGLSWKNSCVLVYGGLRGAVGLALALIVEQDQRFEEGVRSRILFHVAGIAMLTLVINGSTTGMLIQALALTRRSAAKQRNFARIVNHMNRFTDQKVSEARQDKAFRGADWEIVEQVAVSDLKEARTKLAAGYERMDNVSVFQTIFPRRKSMDTGPAGPGEIRRSLDRVRKSFDGLRRKSSSMDREEKEYQLITPDLEAGQDGRKAGEGHRPSVVELDVAQENRLLGESMVHDARHRYLTAIKTSFWHQFEAGLVSSAAVRVLMECVDEASDNEMLCTFSAGEMKGEGWEGWDEWQLVEKRVRIDPGNYLVRMSGMPKVGRFFHGLLFRYLTYAYDVASAYIRAHRHVGREVHLMSSEEAIVRNMVQEASSNVQAARQFLKDIDLGFPEISRSIKTKNAAYFLLKAERANVELLANHGQLEMKEGNELLATIDHQLRSLAYHPPLAKAPSPEKLLGEVSWLKPLGKREIEIVLNSGSMHTYGHGEFLIEQGVAVNHIAVILRGQVRTWQAHYRRKTSTMMDTSLTRSDSGVHNLAPIGTLQTSRSSGRRGSVMDALKATKALWQSTGIGSSPTSSNALLDDDERLAPTNFIVEEKTMEFYGPGAVVGEVEVLSNLTGMSNCQAESVVTVFQLSRSTMNTLMEKIPTLERDIWRMVASVVLDMGLVELDPTFDVSAYKRNVHLDSELVSAKLGDAELTLENSALLLHGQVLTGKGQHRMHFKYLDEMDSPILLHRGTRLLLCRRPQDFSPSTPEMGKGLAREIKQLKRSEDNQGIPTTTHENKSLHKIGSKNYVLGYFDETQTSPKDVEMQQVPKPAPPLPFLGEQPPKQRQLSHVTEIDEVEYQEDKGDHTLGTVREDAAGSAADGTTDATTVDGATGGTDAAPTSETAAGVDAGAGDGGDGGDAGAGAGADAVDSGAGPSDGQVAPDDVGGAPAPGSDERGNAENAPDGAGGENSENEKKPFAVDVVEVSSDN
eukprot:Rmarinus@m.15345